MTAEQVIAPGSPYYSVFSEAAKLGLSSDLLRRVELYLGVARRSLAYARQTPHSHAYVTASAKVTITQECMQVVDEALQLFGGAGLSREYAIEKLCRDARAAQIEDGENRLLSMRLGVLAQQLYAEGWSQN